MNDLVPQGAEVVLLSWRSITYVKIRESPEDVRVPRWKIGAKELAGDVDQNGK